MDHGGDPACSQGETGAGVSMERGILLNEKGGKEGERGDRRGEARKGGGEGGGVLGIYLPLNRESLRNQF